MIHHLLDIHLGQPQETALPLGKEHHMGRRMYDQGVHLVQTAYCSLCHMSSWDTSIIAPLIGMALTQDCSLPH